MPEGRWARNDFWRVCVAFFIYVATEKLPSRLLLSPMLGQETLVKLSGSHTKGDKNVEQDLLRDVFQLRGSGMREEKKG